jgi:hypothetical protein
MFIVCKIVDSLIDLSKYRASSALRCSIHKQAFAVSHVFAEEGSRLGFSFHYDRKASETAR